MFLKEIEDTSAKLDRNYDRRIEELTARENCLQTTCKYITRQRQQEAQAIRDELDTFRTQYEMGETTIKAIVTNHRLKLNSKVEKALARGWQEWSAQAVKLQVFRADTENQEEGGFYKMDEHNIKTLRADLTEDYQNLVKSHTALIEQLLEEFNDDQIMF